MILPQCGIVVVYKGSVHSREQSRFAILYFFVVANFEVFFAKKAVCVPKISLHKILE